MSVHYESLHTRVITGEGVEPLIRHLPSLKLKGRTFFQILFVKNIITRKLSLLYLLEIVVVVQLHLSHFHICDN